MTDPFEALKPAMYWDYDSPEESIDDPEEFLTEADIYTQPHRFMRAAKLPDVWGVFVPTEFKDSAWGGKYASKGYYREFDTKEKAEEFCTTLANKDAPR